MNVDKIQAGREMDALIAEKITGFKPVTMTAGIPPHFIYPQYSTDIAAAWKIVEKLQARFNITICVDDGGKLFVAIFMPRSEPPGVETAHEAMQETAPLAICRAALKAVGLK